MAGRLLDILRLSRLHTGAATAFLPTLAAVVCGADVIQVILVFSSALGHHAWGFSLNEIIDRDIDSRSGYLSHKPLVSGRISPKLAWSVSLSSLFLSFVLMTGATLMGAGNIAIALALLTLSTIAGSAYNLLGKRIPFSDAFVGAWFGLLILSGASAVGIPPSYLPIVSLIALVSGIHLLFNNMIEGGMKDAEDDRRSGVSNFAVVSGVRCKRGIYSLTNSFILMGMSLRFVFIISLLVLALLTARESDNYDLMPFTVALSLVVFAQSMAFLRRKVKIPRTRLLRFFSVHEISSYSLSVLALWTVIGPVLFLIAILLPFLWFFVLNRAMYKGPLVPGV
ncbi:MAG: UbiA family prenyltransferase [Candidatus Thermoplasmatota archaeon]|nr:UbiA family prenyltransferase [Candidatus Thermoplasmatota archaeon]